MTNELDSKTRQDQAMRQNYGEVEFGLGIRIVGGSDCQTRNIEHGLSTDQAARERSQQKGSLMNWYIEVLKKYAVFTGRARRTEYWMFLLFNIIIAIVLAFVDAMAGMTAEGGQGVLGTLYSLAVLLPGLGVTVRRLHDTDKSGWWLLIALVPLAGAITLLVFMLLDSQRSENRFGPNPKMVADA